MLKQLSLVFFVILIGCYIGVNFKELKHLTDELEVHGPANEVWELYRSLGIAKLNAQRLKKIVQNIEVLSGDGGVGTVIKITFVPGNSSYTEKLTVIDDRKRVKVLQGLEGDCLAIGCSVQIVRFEIIEKSHNSSIIKSSMSYAVKKEFKANDPKPSIQNLAATAQLAKEFLEGKNKLE